MAKTTVAPPRDAEKVRTLLDSPEIRALIERLQNTRQTGRPGYPVRAMVGMVLVKSLYRIPVWTRVVHLVNDHAGLQAVLGCAPSLSACYRFQEKLRDHPEFVAECVVAVQAQIRDHRPEYGNETVAIDGSNLPAYANGHRTVTRNGPERTKFSDPDASWGHRSAISTMGSGGYYGYKVHAAVCAKTDLPLAWETLTAAAPEGAQAPALLDAVVSAGFRPQYAVMDKGYDAVAVYNACEARGIRPIIPLRKTTAVENGRHKPPTCEHGEWKFAGASERRKAAKWRCPTGQCTPASTWIKADRLHTLVPRSTDRWGTIYAQRGAVEREFGRLKHEWGMLPLRTRTLRRVRTHVDLTILTCLASALVDARAATVPLVA